MARTSDDYDGTLDFNEAMARKASRHALADDRRAARAAARRLNRPLSVGDRVESRIGERRRGIVCSVANKHETFGMRAVFVIWSGDVCEQLCATCDLRRVR